MADDGGDSRHNRFNEPFIRSTRRRETTRRVPQPLPLSAISWISLARTGFLPSCTGFLFDLYLVVVGFIGSVLNLTLFT